MPRIRLHAVAVAIASVFILGSQVVGAAPAGAPPPAVVAAALGGSITALTPCNGPPQTVENAGFLKVERPGASNGTLLVNVTYGGSLMSGTDYDPLPNPIEIPSGQTQTLLEVRTSTPGTVSLTVLAGDGYIVGDPATATATFTQAVVPTFCTEAIVETIAIGEQPTSFLVEDAFEGIPVADTQFQPSGEAPPGLTLNRDGSWGGAATAVGTYEVTGQWCLGVSLCVIEVPWRITVVAGSGVVARPAPPAAAVQGSAAYTG